MKFMPIQRAALVAEARDKPKALEEGVREVLRRGRMEDRAGVDHGLPIDRRRHAARGLATSSSRFTSGAASTTRSWPIACCYRSGRPLAWRDAK